ncbi:hypothetical protein [Burkholderia ubonensis]|uniref:hypothetical protein n=1 Tax=Burkholderia ubonensis TaxID=101571 RepID=UPI000758EA85|nr:hypothetical protein [Burkholderia ubonensis]KVS36817.1 hypothetical protein WK37_30780 [Burkholderia ubonensis]KVS47664.1 hypothetical protein WK38_21635 [Burkholderia ubonensis]KVS70975.1 hypothetical protein WK42_26700 [Burkholderia ubonensis]KVS83208.1 hypothetical protein WK44_02855 [Burkholderia ubonensis]KVS93116.1 hypothetical protein WK43_11915 [Burkholderia ubonensis]
MTRKSTSTVEAKIKKFILHELRDGRRVPSKDIFARAVEQGISENTLAKYAKQWRGTYQVGRRHEWFLLPEPADERPVSKIHDSAWPYPHIHPRILSKDELLRMLDGSDDPLISRLIELLQEEGDERGSDQDDEVADETDSDTDQADGYFEALSDIEDELLEIEGATPYSMASRQIFDRMNGWIRSKRKSLGTK